LGDIEGTAVVITARGVAAAERFVGRVYDAFDLLAGSPNLGHRRTDLTPLPVVFRTLLERYAVVYRKAEPPQIVRVVAWRRDVGRLLKGEGGAARP
jgi:plasmid stabilization system protein ParE